VGGHRPAVRGSAGTARISMTSCRSRLQDVRALTVSHRFKVKAFSSIWNGLTEIRAGGTLAWSRRRRPRLHGAMWRFPCSSSPW
jgi:hypothetical protein